MNILLITPTLPYPPDAGGKIVIYNTIKYLSQRHNISLLSLIQPGQEKFISSLRPYCRKVEVVEKATNYQRASLLLNLLSPFPYTVNKFFEEDFKKKLQKLIKEDKFDLIQIEHLHMAQYVDWINQGPVLLREHNIETVMMFRYFKFTENWLEKIYALLQWIKLKKYEQHTCRLFDACLFFSLEDSLYLRTAIKKTYVLPCGVDTEYFRPRPEMEQENKIIFVGNFNFKPTMDGLLYCLKEIWPLLKKELPGLEFWIVGPYPEKRIQGWKNERNLFFTGYVEDVRPYLWKSTVVLVPLRIASGVRLKILESMAAGKPIVSTSVGCEGLEVTDSHQLFIADSPEEFTRKTVNLLKAPNLRRLISQAALELVNQKYSWPELIKRLEKIYQEVMELR